MNNVFWLSPKRVAPVPYIVIKFVGLITSVLQLTLESILYTYIAYIHTHTHIYTHTLRTKRQLLHDVYVFWVKANDMTTMTFLALNKFCLVSLVSCACFIITVQSLYLKS